MTSKLLIARHGNTFAPGDVVTRVGTTDLPLVESGLIQGRNLGIYLKQNHLIPDVIFTSQLLRAIQTAEQAITAMQRDLPLQALSIFNEIDYGVDENQPEEQVLARIGQEALKDWETRAVVPEGWQVNPDEIISNWQLFSEQIKREFSGKIILVVTSNGIARFAPYLTGDFASFSAKHAIKISTGALGIFENTPAAETWRCLAWNIKPVEKIL